MVRRQLRGKVDQVNEFNITLEKVKKELGKRKGWTAPGIDGIQNYWWKMLEPAQEALMTAFTKTKEEEHSSVVAYWKNCVHTKNQKSGG